MKPLQIIEDHHLFTPNPGGQARFMSDLLHRYVALAGGWGAGKTWAGARKSADIHVYNAFRESGEPTYCRGLIVAPTYALALTINLPEMRSALDEMNIAHRYIGPPRCCIELPDLGSAKRPSQILIRSAEEPQLITGFEVGWVWGDEAGRWRRRDDDPTLDAFLQADGRLRDPRARILQMNLTFTHEGDSTRVYEAFEKNPSADHALYRAGTVENPCMSAFIEAQKRQLSADLARQYLDGFALARRDSLVYSSFDLPRNTDATLAIHPDRPLQVAVDFNISPGMHAIVGQHFPEDDLLTSLYEIHEPGMDVRRVCMALRELLKQLGHSHPGPIELFGDASGNGRWAGSGLSCWDVLAESLRAMQIHACFNVPAANPHVVDRVNAVNCALCSMEGRARYRIHPRCVRLIEDYRNIRWQRDGSIDKRDATRTHASDADGYRVAYLMPIGRRRESESRIATAY